MFMHNFDEHCGCCHCDTPNSAPSRMPLIGDAAPKFVAETTNGTVRFPDDYAGKWVILFSHPADFTPVCTTEFMTFQSMINEFKELNTEIIGLSVGTLTGHLAWIDAIANIKYRDLENINITFPIIDDMNMNVAKMYGMIHPHTSDTRAVRAVFIINPVGVIQAILYYPLTTGRNFTEIKRLLIALQTTSAFGVSTPADWNVGDDVVVGAPNTTTAMQERISNKNNELNVLAWFLSLKKLSQDTIMKKLHSGGGKNNMTKK